MNAEVHLIGFAAWLAKKVDENLACEFHVTIKNNYLHMKRALKLAFKPKTMFIASSIRQLFKK